jgi:chemotaxis protein MotB
MIEEERNVPVRTIVKRRKGHEGSHGGAWKVAYADFVTAMMALFIVLWILGQSKEVREAVAAYFKDPGLFMGAKAGFVSGQVKSLVVSPPISPDKNVGEMERLKAEAGSLQKTIASIPDFGKFKDKIQVVVTQEGLRIDLVEASEGLFFDIGKAHLKPEAVRLIKLIAPRLAALGNDIVLEGYTDARPYASEGYTNWDLSADRANAARKVLEESGLRKDQVRAVRGFADRKLRIPDKPYDYRNRRVSIVVQSRQPAVAARPERPLAAPHITPIGKQ